MNRFLLLGIAAFVAIVGIALMGGESQVLAGHGCSGCSCSSDCGGCSGDSCSDSCSSSCHCSGRKGLFARLRARHCHCSSSCNGCNGGSCHSSCSSSCDGGGCHEGAHEAAPAAPVDAAPPAPAEASRPFSFRKVSFRR